MLKSDLNNILTSVCRGTFRSIYDREEMQLVDGERKEKLPQVGNADIPSFGSSAGSFQPGFSFY